MRHHNGADPPFFEIAEGVRVAYTDSLWIEVDGKLVGRVPVEGKTPAFCALSLAETVAKIYDKGRDDEFKNRDAVYVKGWQDALKASPPSAPRSP